MIEVAQILKDSHADGIRLHGYLSYDKRNSGANPKGKINWRRRTLYFICLCHGEEQRFRLEYN